MGFGKAPVPDGTLPIFSVNTKGEARRLLIITCPTNYKGEFIARELAQEQTLENLYHFGDRLRAIYESPRFIKNRRFTRKDA